MAQPFGRYNLLEFLASGGMADVHRAEITGPAGFLKEVAIKLIRRDFNDRPELVEMFKQEARLASKLTHANIVQVFDFGQVDDQYFIAMEYVRGHTLRQLVDGCRSKGIRLGLARAVHICTEVATALDYAHRLKDGGQPLGLVHRDVSPHNVLISFEGEVKLTDFGIARAMGASELTAPGTVKGKAAYMAPEQARAETVDGRADLFALGVMLWELATGAQLFARESDAATLAAVISEGYVAKPSNLNELVPPELDAAILGALERDREKRTPSAQEMVKQLSACLLQLMVKANNPAETDLRAFMHRIWPEGPTSPGRQIRIETLRRPAPLAAGAAAETRPQPEALADTRRTEGPFEDDIATRTGTALARDIADKREKARRRKRLLVVGAALLAIAAVPLAFVARRSLIPSRPVAPAIAATGQKHDPQRGSPAAATEKVVPPAAPAPAQPPAPAPGPNAEPAPGQPPAALAEPPKPPPSVGPEPAQPARVEPPAAPSSIAPRVSAIRERPSSREPSQPRASAKPEQVQVTEVKPPETGESHLEVRPTSWAIFYLDGRRIGITPSILDIPSGKHHLRAERNGFETVEQNVDLQPGESRRWAPQIREH